MIEFTIVRSSSPRVVRDEIVVHLWREQPAAIKREAQPADEHAPEGLAVSLTYAGTCVATTRVSRTGRRTTLRLSHEGGRLDPGAFALQCQAQDHRLRGELRLVLRAETYAERAVADLPPPGEPLAGLADLLALRQAMRA